MLNIFLRVCILNVILFLASCKGCPHHREVYVVFHNTTNTEVTIEFRLMEKENINKGEFSYFVETFQPDEIKDIKISEYTVYYGSKGFALPESACSDKPTQSLYITPNAYSYSTLSNFMLCEWETLNYMGMYPIEIHYTDSQCEAGYVRAYNGF